MRRRLRVAVTADSISARQLRRFAVFRLKYRREFRQNSGGIGSWKASRCYLLTLTRCRVLSTSGAIYCDTGSLVILSGLPLGISVELWSIYWANGAIYSAALCAGAANCPICLKHEFDGNSAVFFAIISTKFSIVRSTFCDKY